MLESNPTGQRRDIDRGLPGVVAPTVDCETAEPAAVPHNNGGLATVGGAGANDDCDVLARTFEGGVDGQHKRARTEVVDAGSNLDQPRGARRRRLRPRARDRRHHAEQLRAGVYIGVGLGSLVMEEEYRVR